MLYSLSLLLTEGTRTIRANSNLAPAGYELLGDDTVHITVDASGAASHSEVAFVYRAPMITADVEILYMAGNTVLVSTTLTLDEGTTDIHPAAALLPKGYVLPDAAPVSVTVDAEGIASPARIIFSAVSE